MTRVLAQATADRIANDNGSSATRWHIVVNGAIHGGMTLPERAYDIAAKAEKDAAMEGIDRYCAEFGECRD